MQRRQLFSLLAGCTLGSIVRLQAAPTNNHSHIEWVSEVLKRMESVKVGETRGALLKVFTTEGGLSNASERVFVSRDCPYFKVHVRFDTVGKPNEKRESALVENLGDTILEISSPYLQFSIAD